MKHLLLRLSSLPALGTALSTLFACPRATAETPAPEAPIVAAAPEVATAEEDAEQALWRRLSHAEGLLRLGRPDAAATLAAELDGSGPHAAAALRVRAWASLLAGRYDEVERLLGGDEGQTSELLFVRGSARCRADARAGGMRDLRSLWWGEPNGAWGLAALRELAELDTAEGSLYDARERQRIRRHVPRATLDASLDALPRTTATLAELAAAMPRQGLLAAEVEHALGFAALEAEEFSQAAVSLRRALRHAPTPELGRVVELRLGEALRRQGAYQSAQRHFARVAGSGDDRFGHEALALSGQMAIEHRRYDDALRLFQAQLVANPVGPARHEALWGLGWVAFRTGDYRGAERFFDNLLVESSHGLLAPRALYWRARTLEELGRGEEALAAMAALERRFPIDYYALRARLWRGSRELEPAPSPAAIEPDRRLARVQSLLDSGMTRRAVRALARLRPEAGSMSPDTLRALEAAALRAGAPDAAQRFRRAREERFPDAEALPRLAERFPQPHLLRLRREAKTQRIDADLPAALVLQESGFRVNAVSPVGALGLMQVMPATARELLHEEKRRSAGTTEELLQPETNVRLGVRYLARMLRSFDRRVEYALAAYNAGPGAVTRWRQARGDLPVDIFVEEIPYAETRTYVSRVLANLQTLHVISTPPAPAVATAEVAARERQP